MRKRWTADEDAVIRARVPNEPTCAVAAALGRTLSSTYQRVRKLGVTKTQAYWDSPASGRTRGDRGGSTRFKKGQIPANKGLRGRKGWAPGRMAEHQFKPGHRGGIAAKNWRPIGTILTDTEGYRRIKVREARPGEAYGFGNVNVWPLMQRHVWRQAHGPIPKGHNIAFRDGNRANCALDNLELISRAEQMRRNSVHNLPKPIANTIQLIGALNRQIRQRTNHATQKQDRRSA